MKHPTVKIRILCSANPKKPGTMAWARFNLYRDGMTPSEFLAAGGLREDLRYDEARGYISTTTLENKPNGQAPDAPATKNRTAAIGRIRALLNKTVENGCTEEEAFSAAQKAGELMDRYGIESSEAEIREEKCTTGLHGGHRARAHESKWVAKAVAQFCDCRVWHRTGTGQLAFFGLPADVEVATYLMGVIEGAMTRGFNEFRKTPEYASADGYYDTPKRLRNTYMVAFANRVSVRLSEMYKARHTENLMTTTGTSLVVVKRQVVDAQFFQTGIRISRAKASNVRMSNNDAARNAGQAAGDKVHLGGAVTGGASVKRLG
jgi:hypothetical protein